MILTIEGTLRWESGRGRLLFCFSELYVAFICRSGGAAVLVLVRLGMGLAPVVLVTLPLVACDTTDERGGSRRESAARHDAADVQWPQLPVQSALFSQDL